MPNPLFIVSHMHVNKKQRRIAASMQDFSRVVRCDAFMPQIRVVQADQNLSYVCASAGA
jgi:hypothetical protein